MPLLLSQVPDGMQLAATPTFPNGSIHAGQYTLIFRIRTISDNTLLKQHSLILMPQRFTATTEARSSLYYTQGGPVADTLPTSGVGITYFTITGHTGYGGVRSQPQNAVEGRLTQAATPERFVQVVQSVF